MIALIPPDYIELKKLPSGRYNIKVKGTGVYILTDPLTGKQYIGSTNNLFARLSKHRQRVKNSQHENPVLRQYPSLESFLVHVKCIEDREEAYDEEQRLINERVGTDVLLNTSVIDVRVTQRGIVRSEELRERIRQARLGTTASEETKRKMSESSKGIPKPEGFGEKLRLANLNHPRRAELDHNLSVTRKSGDNPNAKPVEVDGVVYPCGSDASRALNIPRSTLERRLNSDKPEYANYRKMA